MKIAYIAASAIPSMTANSVQVMKVCQALTQNGHSVELFVPGIVPINWGELKPKYGIGVTFPIRRVPASAGLKRFDFILRCLYQAKKERFDLVYTRMAWAARGAQLLNLPVIFELHDIPSGRLAPAVFKGYAASEHKKLTVCITRALRRLVEKKLGIHFNGFEVIVAPDGVDLERFAGLPDQRRARKQVGLPEKTTAVYTGGFYQGRGIEALFELAKDFPEIQFLWVGGNMESVALWSERLQIAGVENVQMTGFIPNDQLPHYMSAADILLMPFGKVITGSSGGNTADICSPMKMFEYMAAGRAILTSDLPVLREVLNETNAAFFIPEDLVDFKSKFSYLLTHVRERDRLADHACKDAVQYSWQNRMRMIVDRMEEILR